MGLVNVINSIEKRICVLLEKIVAAEKCGGDAFSLDEKIKKMSIISGFWNTWSEGQILELESYLFTS